jgi:hypothetical protein
MGKKSLFKEHFMAKGRGGKGGVGFIPTMPGGNKPSKTGNVSGGGRGNLPPKSDE